MGKILLRDRPDPILCQHKFVHDSGLEFTCSKCGEKGYGSKPELLCPTCIKNNNCSIGRSNNYLTIQCSGYCNRFIYKKHPHIILGLQYV